MRARDIITARLVVAAALMLPVAWLLLSGAMAVTP